MQPSVWSSVFYLVSFLACWTGLTALKKSEKPLDFLVWLPVSVLLLMCWDALFAAVVSFAGVPVNLLTVGVFNLLTAAALWGIVLRTRQRQHYCWQLWTVISFCAVAVLTVLLVLRQFGPSLTIHFCTMDPGVHLRNAMDVVNTQQVEGMFFSALHNALFIEMFSPLVSSIWYYKLFLISDALMFALSGWIFTALIASRCKTRWMRIAGFVILLLFLLGYPLNNMEYGFVYWGAGGTLTCLILFLTDRWAAGGWNSRLTLGMISVGCFGLFVCYILFAPIVWAAVFVMLAIRMAGEKMLLTRRGIGALAGVFFPPGVLALLWYFLRWESSSGPMQILSLEGFIFQDLFASFVPFLPIALYGLYVLLRRKKYRTSVPLFFVLTAFIAVFFALAMLGRVSAYYYYKPYYLLWIVMFDLLVCGVAAAAERSKGLLCSYSLVWAAVGVLALSGADRAIHEQKPYLNPEPSAGAFFRLYQFNIDNPSWAPMDPGALELFQYVRTNYAGETVPLVGTQEQYGWYEGISDQRLSKFRFWNYELSEVVERIQQCEYAVVIKNNQNDLYQYAPAYWESLERVYENSSGYLVRIQPKREETSS